MLGRNKDVAARMPTFTLYLHNLEPSSVSRHSESMRYVHAVPAEICEKSEKLLWREYQDAYISCSAVKVGADCRVPTVVPP